MFWRYWAHNQAWTDIQRTWEQNDYRQLRGLMDQWKGFKGFIVTQHDLLPWFGSNTGGGWRLAAGGFPALKCWITFKSKGKLFRGWYSFSRCRLSVSRTCSALVGSFPLQPQLCTDLICKANKLKFQTPGQHCGKARLIYCHIYGIWRHNSKQNSLGVALKTDFWKSGGAKILSDSGTPAVWVWI